MRMGGYMVSAGVQGWREWGFCVLALLYLCLETALLACDSCAIAWQVPYADATAAMLG
jgi:hypothetical protein